MSRFYKTDRGRGNFDIDFTYRPPWELAQMALATQQQGYDDMLQASTLFDNIDIKHIGTEQEKQAVNNITQSYTDRANTIANQMQGDKNNWRKYSRELRTLQRDLQKDMTTGNIASIQNNYAQMQDYMKRNEELRKTDPRRYEAAMAEAMSRFNSSLGGDTWSQQDILKGPDFDAILKEINDLKSNKSKRVQKNPNGRGYIIDNSYEVDELTPERIAQYAASRLMSDPNNMHWARQTQDWGLGTGYFNEDGSMVNMFTENEIMGTDAQGNPITRKMLGINPESGFSPFLNSAIQKSFRDESIGESWSADATYNAAMGRQNDLDKIILRARLDNENAKKNDKDNFMRKVVLDSYGVGEDAETARRYLASFNAYSTLVPTKPLELSLEDLDATYNPEVSGLKANLFNNSIEQAYEDLAKINPDKAGEIVEIYRTLKNSGKDVDTETVVEQMYKVDPKASVRISEPNASYDVSMKKYLESSNYQRGIYRRSGVIPQEWEDMASKVDDVMKGVNSINKSREDYMTTYNNTSQQTSFTPINASGSSAVVQQIIKYPEQFTVFEAKNDGKKAMTENTHWLKSLGDSNSKPITIESLGNDFIVRGMQSNLSTNQTSVLVETLDGRQFVVADNNIQEAPGKTRVNQAMWHIALNSTNDPALQNRFLDYETTKIEEHLSAKINDSRGNVNRYELSLPDNLNVPNKDFTITKNSEGQIKVYSPIFPMGSQNFNSVRDVLEVYRKVQKDSSQQ